MYLKALSAAIFMAISGMAFAQQELQQPYQSSQGASDKPRLGELSSPGNYMKSMLDTISSGDYSSLPPDTQKAIRSGVDSAYGSSNFSAAGDELINMTVEQSKNWEKSAREAYVAALPPRDRERGKALLLDDGVLPGTAGRLYIFVSRSMPRSLLRAYALEALHLDATLVVKGLRKGDNVKDFVMDAFNSFNSIEGQGLSALSINPNMFDMFQVSTVPAVVWTNRVGLDDIGSGCFDLPEGSTIPLIELEDKDGNTIMAPKPICAPVPESNYYKITGALNLPYVFDKFEEAGLSKEATSVFRQRLSNRHSNVFDGTVEAQLGNEMRPLRSTAKLNELPREVMEHWREQLKTNNVRQGPYGPAFGKDAEDDPDYRRWLEDKIRISIGDK